MPIEFLEEEITEQPTKNRIEFLDEIPPETPQLSIVDHIKNFISAPQEPITYTSGTGFTQREVTPEEQKAARETLVSFGLGVGKFPLSRLTNLYKDPEIQQIIKDHPLAAKVGEFSRDLLLLKGLGMVFRGIATVPQISNITNVVSKAHIINKLSQTTKLGKQFLNYYELDRYVRTAVHGALTFGAWQALKEAGEERPDQNLLNSIANIGMTATWGAGRGIITAIPDFALRVVAAGVYGSGTTLLAGGNIADATFNGALLAGFEIIAGKDIDRSIKYQAFLNMKKEGYDYLIRKGMNPFEARKAVEISFSNMVNNAGGIEKVLENTPTTNMNFIASEIRKIDPSWKFTKPPQIALTPEAITPTPAAKEVVPKASVIPLEKAIVPLAIRLKSGEIITDSTAKLHSDIIANKNISPDTVQDVGIVGDKGEYQATKLPDEKGGAPLEGNWELGQERKFAFDPNSTKNEGRFRLYPAEEMQSGEYRSQTSIKSRGIEETPGVRFILGKTIDGESVIQTIRFNKSQFTEEQAAQWWEKNKDKFEFYQKALPEVPKEAMEKAKELVKSAITPEKIKPDVSGVAPLQKQIQAMKERQARVETAQYALEEIDTVRDYLKRRITKYKDAYLKEELTGIPSIFITKEGGIKPDEAMDELRTRFNIEVNDETGLKEYLQNLEKSRKDLISEIETYRPGFITKKETTLLADKIKAVEMGIREGKIQAKAEVKQVQEEIIDLMEDLRLETDDKAKFLRTMKNVQTKEQLQKVLPEITERLYKIREQSERSELVADLRDLFERQPTKNLPIEYKDVIEDIKSKVLLKERKPKVKKRLENMRQFVERMAEQGEEINIPQEKLDLLDKASVDEMTTEQLRDLKETIERLYHLGKLKNKLLTVQKEREFEAIVKEGIDKITKGKGINEETPIIKILREQHKGWKDKSLDFLKNYIAINMRPELMVNYLDGLEPAINTDVIWNSLWEAEKNKLTESNKTLKQISEIHKSIKFDELNKEYKIGRFENMTKDNALFIYANSFNDNNRIHLYGSGITDEDIIAVENFLSVEEKQAVKDMIKLYDEAQYPMIDKIYSALEGVHLGKETDYFPIDRLEDISYNKELEKNILEAHYVRRAGVSKGFTKERVTSKKGYSELSYFDNIIRNWQKVEHYKAYAQAIRDVNKYLGNPEVKQAIKQNFGDKYYGTLEKWFKDVSYGRDKTTFEPIDLFIKWLRTNYTTSVLGINITSMLKQPVSFLQGMEMAGKDTTLKALAKFIANPLKMIKFTEEKSPLMKYRWFSQERELREILEKGGALGKLGIKNLRQKIREESMLPIQIADKVTVTIIWEGAYRGALADGLNEVDAVEFADRVIRRTQPMGGIIHLPSVFRGPEYQKIFTLFRNQLNQNFNLLLESILKKKTDMKGWGKFTNQLLFYLLLPAFMIGLLNRKRLQENVGELAKDILNQATGGLFLVGNMMNMFASGFPSDIEPLQSMADDIYWSFNAKKVKTRMGRLLDIFGVVTGLPILGVKRIITGKPLGEIKKKKEKKGLSRGKKLKR